MANRGFTISEIVGLEQANNLLLQLSLREVTAGPSG